MERILIIKAGYSEFIEGEKDLGLFGPTPSKEVHFHGRGGVSLNRIYDKIGGFSKKYGI